MLKIKQESCEYQLLSRLVRLDEGIDIRSIDYEADALTASPRAG